MESKEVNTGKTKERIAYLSVGVLLTYFIIRPLTKLLSIGLLVGAFTLGMLVNVNFVKVFKEVKTHLMSMYYTEDLTSAIFLGKTEKVLNILNNTNVDPAAADNLAIRRSASNGHLEVVRLLLADPRVDPAAVDNYAIGFAARNGHLEVVRLLLADPRVDPTADNDWAIRYAADCGHLEVVKLLLQDKRVRDSLNSQDYSKYLEMTK